MKKAGKRNRRKRSKGGGDNKEDKKKEPQAFPETMKYCCKVCFDRYSETHQRPRVLPCGHSFCSLCITSHLMENKIVCPTCRKDHYADNTTDFPINYELEHNQTTTSPIPDDESHCSTDPAEEEPRGISRMLCSAREEHCKEMVKLETEVRGKRINLQGYESQMSTWKEEHENQLELHLCCAQEHREVITRIDKENQNVKESSGQADNILQEVTTSANGLKSANTNRKLLSSMEKSNNIYDTAHEWNSDIEESYPDSALIIKSQKLRGKSRFLLGKWKASSVVDQRHQDNTASSAHEMSACSGQKDMEVEFTNIQEKIKGLLNDLESFQKDQITQTEAHLESLQKEIFTQTDESFTSKTNQTVQTEESLIFNIFDLKALTPSARSLIESNRLFAFKQQGSETRYAKITIDKYNDVCLHTLRKDVEIPPNAILLQHGDVVGANISPGLTFLDLAAEGRPLGRLRIRLVPRGNFPLNFHLLCTGEKGPSYIHSVVGWVGRRGRDEEKVYLGDYERNDGFGGRGVVPWVDWKDEWEKRIAIYRYKKLEAGSVGIEPSIKGNEMLVSHFVVYTQDRKNLLANNLIGKLDDEESLEILKEALDRFCHERAEEKNKYTDVNLKKIVIADCGVILPRH